MTAPNMAAITASLERSLQSFSLNHHQSSISINGYEGLGFGRSSSSSSGYQNNRCLSSTNSSDATLELNSNITLPYHWEQCLDLKTGEVYYINWRTGMKSKEDPRTVDGGFSGYFYSDEEEAEEEEESSYGSGGSSVESSPAASSSRKQNQNQEEEEEEEEEVEDEEEDEDEDENIYENGSRIGGHVLVVAGCKGCFMYFMVPKQVEDCPKCCGQLLHFDRSDDNA
ncbi:unnamed protein product [Lactuca virosa]|uniref:WW domain-containing protein n=1 Tax=Lactuca virosa TaxID=75947 RepID=A0AAU9N4M6_9ASTR|nr:unnamed protein product [Lactuca virosa]